VLPNLGKSQHLDGMIAEFHTELEKGDDAIKVWASQHLNIEIGIGISNEGWRGADYWEAAADETLTLATLLERSEVVTVGIDGGGLDDLLGFAVIGREKGTRHWLIWNYAWAHPKVLELRQDIAPLLKDFVDEGSMTLCEVSDYLDQLTALLKTVLASGKLPEKNAAGIDPNNAAVLIEALAAAEFTDEMIRRLLQGPALAPALYGLELKLSDNTVWHGGSLMMNWVLGNAKLEARGNQVMVTKAVSGRAKIDPLIATFQAAILMSWNPMPKTLPKYQMLFV
jgi:phage terminase large subunit-like protein